MATVSENLTRIQNAKEDIRTSIEAKGVTVDSSLAIENYAAKVDLISSGGPYDYLSAEDIYNQITADWPDLQSIVESTGGSGYKHIYLYRNIGKYLNITIDATITSVITSDGVTYNTAGTYVHTWDNALDINSKYRWAIKIHASLSSPTKDNSAIGHGCSSEVYTAQTDYTEQYFQWLSLITIADFDTSACVNLTDAFSEAESLITIPPNFDSSNVTNFDYVFDGAISLIAVPDFSMAMAADTYAMFRDCHSLKRAPETLDFSGGDSFSRVFEGCYSLIYVPSPLNLTGVSNLREGCHNCVSLEYFPDVYAPSAYSHYGIFEGCHALKEGPSIQINNGNNFGRLFLDCLTMNSIRIKDASAWNIAVDLEFSAAPVERDDMVALFNQLPNATATITISTYTDGVLSAADRLIITDKGWTIAVSDV